MNYFSVTNRKHSENEDLVHGLILCPEGVLNISSSAFEEVELGIIFRFVSSVIKHLLQF